MSRYGRPLKSVVSSSRPSRQFAAPVVLIPFRCCRQLENETGAAAHAVAVRSQAAFHVSGGDRRRVEPKAMTVRTRCESVSEDLFQVFAGDANAIVLHDQTHAAFVRR